jgi:membrane dipeptidase
MHTFTAVLGLAVSLAAAPQSEQELVAKARGIHQRVLTLDTHKDINPTLALGTKLKDPKEVLRWRARNDPTVEGTNQVDFPKMRKGSYDAAFFIVYVGQGELSGGGYINAKRSAFLKFDAIHRMCNKYPEHIGLAYTPDDVRKFHEAGRLTACIGIENGYPMGTNLALIEDFHKRGARYMGIAHNRHSQLGDSHTPDKPLHGGLSDLGRKAVAEMNRVGIMVDISHSAKSTMLQVLEITKAPVLASHSGCRAICDVSRNLDDEQLRALKKNGGVMQCVALGSFVVDSKGRTAARAKLREEVGAPSWQKTYELKEKGNIDPKIKAKIDEYEAGVKELDKSFPKANVKDFVNHIDHAAKIMGVDHVAISSDFDGGGGIDGWSNASETFNVTLELVRRGYSEEQIGKIWSGNTLRLWGAVEKVAARIQKAAKK